MNKYITYCLVVVSFILTGCTTVVGPTRPIMRPEVSSANCPPPVNLDAVKRLNKRPGEYIEGPRVHPLYNCTWMQPIIAWASQASLYEHEKGGCRGGRTSFTCSSERGPSGRSQYSKEWAIEGSRLMLEVATQTLPACPHAASEKRYLNVRVDRYGMWEFKAHQVCYF